MEGAFHDALLIIYGAPNFDTGKSFSEALILGSVNSQYDDRLFIDF